MNKLHLHLVFKLYKITTSIIIISLCLKVQQEIIYYISLANFSYLWSKQHIWTQNLTSDLKLADTILSQINCAILHIYLEVQRVGYSGNSYKASLHSQFHSPLNSNDPEGLT